MQAMLVQTGEPIGVRSDDLGFTSLLENGHIRTTTGQFVAVVIVSDEMRPGVARADRLGSAAVTGTVSTGPGRQRVVSRFRPAAGFREFQDRRHCPRRICSRG